MHEIYGRDLDLNLLRVFAVVAEAGSVTEAAARLYLTQPALSAALKRLTTAVGAPLLTRQGRGVVLTARGQRLFSTLRPHLEALVSAALSPPGFSARDSERTLRIGMSDAAEGWLLPPLLRVLGQQAPRMRLIVVPVQFRSLGEALSTQRVDLAISVADELPAGCKRQPLFGGGFVCLYDPRHVRLPARPTQAAYLAQDHVVVSYNNDLRGIVEDMLGLHRRVRCSVPSFSSIGAIVDGSALVATVPTSVARTIRRLRPHLRSAPLPFSLAGSAVELIWRGAVDDDDACRFIREHIVRIAKKTHPKTR
jgi:LysR family transcriptional activator of mexEF-oprN operon